ncbi:hypothetical protein, partial [Pantoea agglomerans]|uniref:hypothetical protein n=1 Tax=Enterobacter agglomerans TaxID=549 RepID=UPI003207F367
RGQFGAGQGGPIPERFVGTTSKPKVPRERREDGPAAAEVLRPALRLARPEKKLARLTVTAFTNLILTDQYYAMGGLFLSIHWPGGADAVKIIIRLIIQACLWPVVLASYFNNIATMEPI